MLCTNCSREIKPVVALDIDGTLGDYHAHFERFARVWLGWPRDDDPDDSYDGSVRYREWFASAYGISAETFRQIKLAYRQGGMKRSMPVFPYADQLTYDLQEYGAEIWLVTTRPYLKHDAIDPDTREWCQRAGIYYDHLLYGPNKFNRLSEQVEFERVAAVLDDDPARIAEAREIGWTAILRRGPYNRAIREVHFAVDLLHASRIIRIELSRWSHKILHLESEVPSAR